MFIEPLRVYQSSIMEEIDLLKYPVMPVKAENYFAWLSDMETTLSEYESRYSSQRFENLEQREQSEVQSTAGKGQKNLALAYILASTDIPCKTMVRRVGCSALACTVLR